MPSRAEQAFCRENEKMALPTKQAESAAEDRSREENMARMCVVFVACLLFLVAGIGGQGPERDLEQAAQDSEQGRVHAAFAKLESLAEGARGSV